MKDKKSEAEYLKLGYVEGVPNESADKVKRKNITWSNTNLDDLFTDDKIFERLCCRNCKGISFEVLSTDSYETSARCNMCGFYYTVHTG